MSGPQEMVETDGLIMPDLGGEGSEARRGWQTGGEGTAGCLGPGLGMERKEGPVHPTSASDGFSCTFLLCKSVLPLCKELRPELTGAYRRADVLNASSGCPCPAPGAPERPPGTPSRGSWGSSPPLAGRGQHLAQVGGPRARDVLLALLDRTPQRLQPLDPELQGGGPPELKEALASSRHHLADTSLGAWGENTLEGPRGDCALASRPSLEPGAAGQSPPCSSVA